MGLGLVSLAGYSWFDPVFAILVACLLAFTGYKLVRESLGGLLDEENDEIIKAILRLIGNDRDHWDVREAHTYTDAFEEALMQQYPFDGELHLHLDPCRRAYCRYCDVTECPIRREPFEKNARSTSKS